jgi:hypothetical protein
MRNVVQDWMLTFSEDLCHLPQFHSAYKSAVSLDEGVMVAIRRLDDADCSVDSTGRNLDHHYIITLHLPVGQLIYPKNP